MKKLLFLISLSAIAAAPTSTSSPVDIDTAIKAGQVKVTAISNGRHAGESVELKINNLRSQQLVVRIPPGFLFYPADDGEQTLITTEEQLITLQPNQATKKVVLAYCCEPSDRCPSESSQFRLDRSTHPQLIKMNEYLQNHKVSASCMQAAVWSIVGDDPIAHIEAQTPEDIAFRSYLSTLTGKENPWYTSPQDYVVHPGEEIQANTVKIEGELRIDVPRNCQIYQDIRDQEGRSKIREIRYLSMPKGDDIRFQFRIQVTGWKKGEYDVYLLTKEKEELAHYTFTV